MTDSRVKSSKWSVVLGTFSMFWIVVTSGGVYFNSKAVVNYLLIFDVVLVTFLLASSYREIVRLHLNALGYFLMLVFVVLLSTIANTDFSSLLTYARLILMLLLAMGVALTLDRGGVYRVFVKTVVVIAAFSVLFFYSGFVEKYAGLFPIIEFNEKDYSNAFVYVHFESVEPRNFGIYFEPGLFQIYLNTAIYILIYAKQKIPYRYVWVGVLLAALLPTNSTTGFILAMIILAGYAIKNQNGPHRIILNPLKFVLVFSGLVLAASSAVFTDNIEEKFLGRNQLSFITRINSTLIDWELVTANPVFGVGVGSYESKISEYDASGLVIDSATNTFSQLAALLGFPFVFLVAIGAFRYIFSLKAGRVDKAVLGLMYVVFFSTEPFVLYPLFYLPTFLFFNACRASR